jgi:hypothetical protein
VVQLHVQQRVVECLLQSHASARHRLPVDRLTAGRMGVFFKGAGLACVFFDDDFKKLGWFFIGEH